MTQESIVEALAQSGITVTQATVSRDLAAIGAVRGAGGYMLSDGGASARPQDLAQLLSLVRDHVIRVSPASSLVVLHTAPGHANFVASTIDSVRPPGMVGCIAGDDTIFIATPSKGGASQLATLLGKALETAR